MHQRLLRLLAPLPAEILLHESVPPNPWDGYKACLERIPPFASHLLIIQDDAIPAPGFSEALEQIALANPAAPVCLFMGAYPAATAARARRAKPDQRYVPLGPSSFMPLVAVLWPVSAARSFLAWSRTARGMTIADDGNAARWLRTTKQQAFVCMPSIVQHDDDAKSVKGGRQHVPWQEGWRQALLLADNATHYDWLA